MASFKTDVDWSFGQLRLADGTQIGFAVGLVEPKAAPEEIKTFSWLKVERGKDRLPYYGAQEKVSHTVLVTTVHEDSFPINFMTVQSTSEASTSSSG